MRPIWKGQISFGLINIPIELYSAEQRKNMEFKLIDSRNKAKIRYERINEETGKEVPWNDVVKAYEFDEGFVEMTDEDFKRAAIESTQAFEIEDFVAADEVDCTYFDKPYYLAPTKQGEKGYVLLREILDRTNKIAIGKVVIRTRQYLGALVPNGDVLILNLLRFQGELRSPKELHIPEGGIKDYKISPKELEMAEKLVESMTVKWQPKKYHDDYRESLMKWIEKKAKLGKIPLPAKQKEKEPASAKVIDFMDLLKKSIKKNAPKKARKTVRKPKATQKRKAK